MDGIQRLSASDFHSSEPIISQPSQLSRHNSQLDFSDTNSQLAQALQTQVTSLFSNGDVNGECSNLPPDGGLTSSEGLGTFIQSLAQTMVNAGLGGVLSVSSHMHIELNIYTQVKLYCCDYTRYGDVFHNTYTLL